MQQFVPHPDPLPQGEGRIGRSPTKSENQIACHRVAQVPKGSEGVVIGKIQTLYCVKVVSGWCRNANEIAFAILYAFCLSFVCIFVPDPGL